VGAAPAADDRWVKLAPAGRRPRAAAGLVAAPASAIDLEFLGPEADAADRVA